MPEISGIDDSEKLYTVSFQIQPNMIVLEIFFYFFMEISGILPVGIAEK